MIALIDLHKKKFRVDLSKPIDISIPLREGKNPVNAFSAPAFNIIPVKTGNRDCETKLGSPFNFRNIFFNPHGNGTHTECIGHISKANFTINRCLKNFFFPAELISVTPAKSGKDRIIFKEQIKKLKRKSYLDGGAVVIRTLPNHRSKLHRNYSGSNPPYFHPETISMLLSLGFNHLLVDLPSIDKEDDGGKLPAHRTFWSFSGAGTSKEKKSKRTITELIFVPGEVPDGIYFLNLQIAGFENDAAPGKPVLFRAKQVP